MVRRVALVLLFCILATGGHDARRLSAADPPATVLKGATVVVGNGQVLTGATVVVRGGLIEAVGATVPTPAGALEVDLKGAFVYPGLIDALTDQGLQKPPADAKEPTDTDSAAMFAYVRAADMLAPGTKELASWRDAGVLAVNVAPKRGIFMGQSAVVNLTAEPSVVKPSVAMRMAFQGLGYRNRRKGQGEPGGIYPTRLIGVQAYIRQTLLDAHYYDDALKVYQAHPQGLEKPVPSRGLEALLPVARRTMPLLVPAEAQREVLRMLDIADETQVNCIIVGGYEAAELATELNQQKTPVVVSLNFPGLEADEHPEMEVALDILRFREHAPKAAGELARAGVRIAFASAGLENGRDFLANLRLAVKQGLPKDAALRAATLTAAEILGVDERLGSIQQGKMANLIVADGDLFADQTHIQSVYVGGARFDVGPAKIAAARPALNPATPPAPRPTVATTPREVLIKNATVMTVTRGTIKGGSVLVRDGKIAAVGTAATVSAGPGALVIDATGKWVTPGLIDEHAHYPTDSHNEATQQFTSMVRLRDNLNPTDVAMYRVLASGVTTINVYHGSVNPIGGQTAVIKARWGKDAHGLLFEGARPGLKMSAEEFPASRTNGAPTSFSGEEAVIRDILSRAQQYRQQEDAYTKQRAAGISPLLPLRRDLSMEPLVEVLKGERAVHVHSLSGPVDDERPMLMMMRLAEEFGFRIKTFEHAAPAFRVADELKRHGAGASLFSFLNSTQTPYNASMLMHKGVTVSINSDGEGLARDLNQQAGLLMRFGLTENEALALVTINPAKQLDIDKRVGSIEVGKDADLVIWTHYPLGIYAVADTVLIDGRVYFTREYDKAQRAWLEAERKRLTVSTARPTAQRDDHNVPALAGRPAMEVTHVR